MSPLILITLSLVSLACVLAGVVLNSRALRPHETHAMAHGARGITITIPGHARNGSKARAAKYVASELEGLRDAESPPCRGLKQTARRHKPKQPGRHAAPRSTLGLPAPSPASEAETAKRRANIIAPQQSVTNYSKKNLTGANFWRQKLAGANFAAARLDGAKFIKADLSRSNLRGASLEEAVFTFADLGSADLGDANLDRAMLRHASLTRADLRGASLVGADLSQAKLVGADLRSADLRGAKVKVADLAGSQWDHTTKWPRS